MTDTRLTDRQRRVLRALERLQQTFGRDRWHLAYEISRAAGVDNGATGAVLASLRKAGLVERRGEPGDGIYEWRRA